MATTHPVDSLSLSEAQTGSLRETYLGRLRRLIRLRRQHEQELNARGIRLLDRTIFAAYYDCRNAGLEREAREILRRAQVELDRSADALAGSSGEEAPPDAA